MPWAVPFADNAQRSAGSSATRMLAAGVPVRTVSGRLGHADASTTLGVYAHFVDASDQDAAAVMGRLVRRPLAEE